MSLLGNSLGNTLVLRKFDVDTSGANGYFVQIEGRPEGIIAWILTTIGIDALTTLRISANELTLEKASLAGRSREIAPIATISNGFVGYSKSIWYLYGGVLAVIYGLLGGIKGNSASTFIIGVLFGGILLALYWFSTRLEVYVTTNGGQVIGLRYKRSVIENVAVDFDKSSSVIEVLQRLMLDAQARREARPGSSRPAQAASPPPAAAQRPAPSPAAIVRPAPRCAKCSAALEPGAQFCDNCGTRVGA